MHFQVLRPVVRNGVGDNAWLQAAGHWMEKLPLLREAVRSSDHGLLAQNSSACFAIACSFQVAFMAATFASTAEIEQQFSLVQMLSSGRKARTSVSHLKSFIKCRAQRLLGFSIILPPSYVVMPPDRASNSIVFPRFSLSQGCHQLILCRLTRSTGALSPRMCLQSTALGLRHSVLSWKCMVAARTHARRSCPEDL